MRFKIISVCVGASLLVAGCGDTTDADLPTATGKSAPAESSSPAVTPSTQASAAAEEAGAKDELRLAVKAYSDAFLTGDATTAYGLLSERCRKRTSLSEFTGIVTAAERMYGSALPLETYSAKVSDDLARVTYTYSIKAINQEAEPWVREGGDWHQDDC
jgi:hypothetical protein